MIRVSLMAAGLAVALSIGSLVWWSSSQSSPPIQPSRAGSRHEPAFVVIADFQNSTNDPAFDRTLEQTLRRALEGASFISAYDRSLIPSTFGVAPPEMLDEAAARVLAVKEGLGVVLSGSIESRGDGYEISVRAAQARTAEEIVSVRSRASSKEQVLDGVTRLVTNVRRALGDETSQSDQLFATRSIPAASLEVVGHYAAAMESQSKGRWEEARQSILRALDLDPKFGLGYQALSVILRNHGQRQDADKYLEEALQYSDGMTEREQFAMRGMYYRLNGRLSAVPRKNTAR